MPFGFKIRFRFDIAPRQSRTCSTNSVETTTSKLSVPKPSVSRLMSQILSTPGPFTISIPR